MNTLRVYAAMPLLVLAGLHGLGYALARALAERVAGVGGAA